MKIRSITSLILLLSCTLIISAQTQSAQQPAQTERQLQQHNLMPAPMSVRFNEGRMPITKAFTVATRGQADDRLRAYVDRMARRLEGRTVMEFSRGLAADASRASLVVECQSTGKMVPALDENES